MKICNGCKKKLYFFNYKVEDDDINEFEGSIYYCRACVSKMSLSDFNKNKKYESEKLINVNLRHINKEITDEEMYNKLKRYNELNKDNIFMSADEWKKLRLIELKKEGKSWSK